MLMGFIFRAAHRLWRNVARGAIAPSLPKHLRRLRALAGLS